MNTNKTIRKIMKKVSLLDYNTLSNFVTLLYGFLDLDPKFHIFLIIFLFCFSVLIKKPSFRARILQLLNHK